MIGIAFLRQRPEPCRQAPEFPAQVLSGGLDPAMATYT